MQWDGFFISKGGENVTRDGMKAGGSFSENQGMFTLPHSRLFAVAALCTVSMASAHENHGITKMNENRRPQQRKLLKIPDIAGFKTLKGDFHMHTAFSDGVVWPNVRVQEAWQEGLDVICITDHIEHQPHKQDLPTNHNRPYEIAKVPADQANLLIIRGSEITRGTPPGHFNAIYLEDSSKLVEDKDAAKDQLALDVAAEQKAFIFWNHPGWKVESIQGSYEWVPFVENLHKDGKLHGIEVINGFGFFHKALDWALDNKLAVLGTSDIHNLTANDYDFANGRTRSMTLVFAKERTTESIREALEAGRTLAWSSEYLAGQEELLKALVRASVTLKPVHHTDGKGVSHREIINDSDLTFTFEETGENTPLPDVIQLKPRSSVVLTSKDKAGSVEGATYRLKNVFVRSATNLTLPLSSLAAE